MSKKQTNGHKAAISISLKQSERELVAEIRQLLALPMNKRTNFLRQRRPLELEQYRIDSTQRRQES